MTDEKSARPTLTQRELHKHFVIVTLRYADTDRQGHVNNAVFATFLESGRVSILYAPNSPVAPPGASFVIARLALDFLAELYWPGEVVVGTTILKLGQSSVTIGQGIFFGDQCVATAETVIVLIDESTRKSRPMPAETRRKLQEYAMPA